MDPAAPVKIQIKADGRWTIKIAPISSAAVTRPDHASLWEE